MATVNAKTGLNVVTIPNTRSRGSSVNIVIRLLIEPVENLIHTPGRVRDLPSLRRVLTVAVSSPGSCPVSTGCKAAEV